MDMGWCSVHPRSCLSILGSISCLLCSTSSHREQTPAGCISQSLISWLLAGFGQWHALVGDGKVGERKRQKYFLPSVPITGSFFSSLGGSSFCPAPIKEAHCSSCSQRCPQSLSSGPTIPGFPRWCLPLSYFTFFSLASQLFHYLKVTAFSVINSFCCGHLKWFLTST